jgi:hypothetical protein
MQNSTYLSIDLDYWKEFPAEFLKKIVSLRVPTAISIEHHKLLPHINQHSQCSRIINVDTHADICGNVPRYEKVNCGTWANFVRWPHKLSYIWSYPENICVRGRTNTEGCWCDVMPEENPFFSKHPCPLCGWESVSRRINPTLKKNELDSVAAVGICVSPYYLPSNDAIQKWTKALLDIAYENNFEIYEAPRTWKKVLNLTYRMI